MGMFGNTNMGESTKHARIKVEIVNSCDAEWKIDILKTEATPPDDLKEALKADCKGGTIQVRRDVSQACWWRAKKCVQIREDGAAVVEGINRIGWSA